MASSFGAFIDLESTPIASPPATVSTIQKSPSAFELDTLNHQNGRHTPPGDTPTGARTPATINELESNNFLPDNVTTDIVQSISNPPKNRYRFLSICLMSLGLGLNDSAPGALIPYMEKAYNIDYAIVALIFIGNAVGFISAAPLTDMLRSKLGRAKMLAMSQLLMAAAYIMMVCQPPFAVVVVSFFFSGLGMAWGLALNNVFCTSLSNATTCLGIFHGSYGIGGILGPLMATALVGSGKSWSVYYFITLSLAVFNAGFAYWSYLDYEKELPAALLTPLERHASRQHHHQPLSPTSTTSDSSNDFTPYPGTARPHYRLHSLSKALRNRTTLLGALFIFSYQGAEVSISGWILTYLLTTREYPASQATSFGYVTSGFWAGITLGRFLLSDPARRVGEKVAVFVSIAGAIVFQLLVWLVPNIIGEAVAVALVGLLLGSVYPCAMVVYSKLLGKDELVSALAFVSAMGSSGGAVSPFMTGLVSQKVGTWVLNPIAIGLFGLMAACWAGLRRVPKRRE